MSGLGVFLEREVDWFTREPCGCVPYTYAGATDPFSYDPDCSIHGDPHREQ